MFALLAPATLLTLVSPASPLTLLLPGALLAHFVAQAATVFRRHIAPAGSAFVAAEFTFLLPVFAHLLT